MSESVKLVIPKQSYKPPRPPPVPPKKDNTLLITIIAILIVLAILVGVAIWYFFFRNRASGTGSGTCTSSAQCTSPLICDTAVSKCKRKLGDNCGSDADCITGTVCSSGTCKLKYGEACNNNSECASPGTCVSGKCSTAGVSCSGVSGCTMPGLTSDQVKCVTGTCGLAPGQECKIGGTDCTSDEVCDIFITPKAQCRLKPTQTCTSNVECQERATCTSGKCTRASCTKDPECYNTEFCAGKSCIPQNCTDDNECITTFGLGSGWKCVEGPGMQKFCVKNGDDCPNNCLQAEDSCAGKICQNSNGQICSSNIECASLFCNQSLGSPVCQATPP